MLGADIGDRLLEEVRALDPDVRRSAPPGVGVFNVAVTPVDTAPRRVLLQRSFQRVDGVRDFNFLLEDTGDDLSLLWFAPEDAEPRGVQVVEAGAVFHYADGPDCVGLRVAGAAGIVYEDCAAAVIDGEVVEARSAIVDDVANGPLYYRRNVTADPVEGELDKGLRLFEQGDMAGAAAAFDSAMSEIDPEAPYDASDLVYNRARALEELGRRQEALALYRSVGDVAYQYLVDEGAGRIEGAPR
jgi:tetratricopeptide (TPR) repeat protein